MPERAFFARLMRMEDMPQVDDRARAAGMLLGIAVGDAVGLPREAMSARSGEKLFGPPPLRHGFLFGRGMTSDDTEHACMTAQALLASGGDPGRFASSLGWRLRGWFLGLPMGVGFATLRSCARLLLGFPPSKSGVRSAGNGPGMRAPVIGFFCRDGRRLEEFSEASAVITHSDPRAVEGSLLLARAAAFACSRGAAARAEDFFPEGLEGISGEELLRSLGTARRHLAEGSAPQVFAAAMGCSEGVSGYINHTVPAVLYCWLKFPGDFRAALEAVILLGGDADTTGAILGGIMGCALGDKAIPGEWVDGILEWPRSVAWMKRLAVRLAEGGGTLPLAWPGLAPRNLLFFFGILINLLKRATLIFRR